MLNFEWCANISMGWARFLVIMAFIVPLIFALTLRKNYIFAGAPDQKKWRNLKWWVFVLVVIQVGIYLYF